MRGLAFAVLIGVAAVSGDGPKAVAETSSERIGDYWVWQKVFRHAGRTKTEPEMVKAFAPFFTKAEMDGVPGISEQDHDLRVQQQSVRQRTNFVTRHWFPYDLNSDLVVTREEIDLVARSRAFKSFAQKSPLVMPTQEQLSQIQSEIAAEILKYFKGATDEISIKDANAMGDPNSQPDWAESLKRSFVPLDLDLDGDGMVSRAEFDASVRRAFADIDRDADGEIDDKELTGARERLHTMQMAGRKKAQRQKSRPMSGRQLANCRLPEIAPEQEFLFVSAGTGTVLTNVVLDDQEETARYKHLTIEPGRKKLVLALTGSRALIWRISGATERVAHVIVGSPPRSKRDPDNVKAAGVIGIESGKVTFAQAPYCVPYVASAEKAQEKQLAATLLQLAGREPGHSSFDAGAGTLALPSMQLDKTQDTENLLNLPDNGGAGALMWARFKGENPMGVVDVDPATVVTNGNADRRDLLPGEAGLAQLLDQGAIEPAAYNVSYLLGNSRVTRGMKPGSAGPAFLSDREIIWFPSHYRVLKKFRMPADLCGLGGPYFVKTPGVPEPDRGTCPQER
ncbi:hypothetical protein [Denitrobaculum tricleocarpae]|uniref:EF-hand domain-containing protein n=1 Tax=Denitrobaculum tricleocarpae TaxID=2591009 RepID=A0A545U2W0_9PROT|nr:hypothetical protein [Denitrobaculum tricleocarpae]TQV83815.1 hypothetical protein FKG95_04340 [Denitrobaculum tricleocarpae]